MAKRASRVGRGERRPAKSARSRPKRTGGSRPPARSSSARKAEADSKVRLNKYLADHGVASRRACDELIKAGKVSVDGEPEIRVGTKIDTSSQTVEVDGRILRPDGLARRYYLLNKPSGVVCTNARNETRPRAVDLITDPAKGRIYTVGRLDEDSKGLILLTTDGEFAQRVSHPRFGVSKTYVVKVQGRIDDAALQRVREGVHLSEGRTSGARVVVLKRMHTYSTLAVTLREGMNREIRRAFARVGAKVVDLKRTRIGMLTDRGLRVGRWRALSREEVEALLNDADEVRASERRDTPKPARRSTGAARGKRT